MNDTDRTPFIFEIREEKYEELAARFAKMVGRARKCKTQPPVFSVIHEADEKLVRSTGETDGLGEWIMIEKWVRFLYVTVEGERPAVDGWNFIATIDHTEAYADEGGNVTGNLIKSVPGAGEIPVSYRSAKPICDHCKSVRRRNETYVVRKGEVTQQIGKNCLADFLPGSSPADLAQQLAWWTEATEILSGGGDEESMGGGRREGRFGLESLLQATQATIEAFGWVSRTKARDSQDQATADRLGVLYMKPSDMSRKNKEDAERIREHYNVEKNTPLIEAALEWVRGLDPEATGDYEYNLHVVCKGETVRNDRVGLACSLLPAHRRFLEGGREKAEFAARVPSEYVGTIGERDLFENCVLKYISEPYQSDFGTTTRLMFLQGDNVLIWWASNPDGFELDTTYDLVATPKAHDEYTNRKGFTTKQTGINRVKIAEEKDKVKFAKQRAKKAKKAKAAEAAVA